MRVTDDKERIEICRKCEHLNPILFQCKKCLCLLAFKTKMKNEDCPIGKWNLPNP